MTILYYRALNVGNVPPPDAVAAYAGDCGGGGCAGAAAADVCRTCLFEAAVSRLTTAAYVAVEPCAVRPVRRPPHRDHAVVDRAVGARSQEGEGPSSRGG